MSARGPYRSHSPQFKVQLCTDIRSEKIGRREAQREHRVSANLVQFWLAQGQGELGLPDQAWVTDLTFVRVQAGFVYVAVILDACSRGSGLCSFQAD